MNGTQLSSPQGPAAPPVALHFKVLDGGEQPVKYVKEDDDEDEANEMKNMLPPLNQKQRTVFSKATALNKACVESHSSTSHTRKAVLELLAPTPSGVTPCTLAWIPSYTAESLSWVQLTLSEQSAKGGYWKDEKRGGGRGTGVEDDNTH